MRWILIVLAAGLAALAEAHAPQAVIDTVIAQEMPASGAPGMAYAIVDAQGVRTGARGLVRLGGQDEVTARTPFLLGSISKSITALSVMQLVEDGAVELDAPIARYLAAFEGRPSGEATVRQYLSHTSGLSTLQGNTLRAEPGGAGSPVQQAAERIAAATPAAPPGVRWDYSNANYVVLGALIETVSDRSYADYVEGEILRPLGMTDSFVSDGAVHPELAAGHQPWFFGRRALEPAPSDVATAPAGGVAASVADMALYLAAMVNGQDDVLSAMGKAGMLRPASPQSPYYGLGWSLDPVAGAAYHTGLTPGVETLAILLPDEGRAAVVLVNAASGFGFGETTQLRFALANTSLGLDAPEYHATWSRKLLFLGFAVAPLVFIAAAAWAATHRGGLRSKSGPSGLFSLWFPLVMTAALAWTAVYLIPRLFGTTLGGLAPYQPDLAVLLIATAAAGLGWALLRLLIAYIGVSKRV